MKNGRVVDCAGLSGLDSADGPVVDASAPGLMAALGVAIGGGADPERTMHEAGVGIARAALRAEFEPGASVRFEVTEPAGGAMQLPSRVPRLIADARKLERSPGAVRGALGGRRKETVQISVPDDSPDSQWGLTTVALRLLRDAARVDTLGELLGAARGGETDEVWAAVDLLGCLGLLRIGDGAVLRPAPDADGTDDIEIEPLVADGAEADSDNSLDEEAEALKSCSMNARAALGDPRRSRIRRR